MSITDPPKILGVGDNVVDRYLDLSQMFPGGNPVNVAVVARRVGAWSGYIGVIGTDSAGSLLRESLVAESVDLRRIRQVDGPNAFAEVTIDDGERVFVRSDKGVSRFTLNADDFRYAQEFDLVHTGEFGGLEKQVPQLAKGSLVSFDIGHQRSEAYLDELLPFLELAFFSASGYDDDASRALLRRAVSGGARLALATRGSDAAMLFDGRGWWRQPVRRVAKVLDTLGSGDSFVAAFLTGHLRGDPHEVALDAAASTAAQTCRHYGAFGYGRALAGVSAT